MGDARWKLRARRWLRGGVVLASAGVLVGGMATAVERGSTAREISEEITELERRGTALQSRVAEAMRRLDSLRSRERILREARRLGLRPASDEEITFLREARAAGEEREP